MSNIDLNNLISETKNTQNTSKVNFLNSNNHHLENKKNNPEDISSNLGDEDINDPNEKKFEFDYSKDYVFSDDDEELAYVKGFFDMLREREGKE